MQQPIHPFPLQNNSKFWILPILNTHRVCVCELVCLCVCICNRFQFVFRFGCGWFRWAVLVVYSKWRLNERMNTFCSNHSFTHSFEQIVTKTISFFFSEGVCPIWINVKRTSIQSGRRSVRLSVVYKMGLTNDK